MFYNVKMGPAIINAVKVTAKEKNVIAYNCSTKSVSILLLNLSGIDGPNNIDLLPADVASQLSW